MRQSSFVIPAPSEGCTPPTAAIFSCVIASRAYARRGNPVIIYTTHPLSLRAIADGVAIHNTVFAAANKVYNDWIATVVTLPRDDKSVCSSHPILVIAREGHPAIFSCVIASRAYARRGNPVIIYTTHPLSLRAIADGVAIHNTVFAAANKVYNDWIATVVTLPRDDKSVCSSHPILVIAREGHPASSLVIASEAIQ